MSGKRTLALRRTHTHAHVRRFDKPTFIFGKYAEDSSVSLKILFDYGFFKNYNFKILKKSCIVGLTYTINLEVEVRMFCCVLFSCVLCQYRILQNLVLFITLAIYCSQYVRKEYTYRVTTQLNSLMFVWKMKECPLHPYFRMWVCACMQRCNTVCRIIVFFGLCPLSSFWKNMFWKLGVSVFGCEAGDTYSAGSIRASLNCWTAKPKS
jgi:hypothetical protein